MGIKLQLRKGLIPRRGSLLPDPLYLLCLRFFLSSSHLPSLSSFFYSLGWRVIESSLNLGSTMPGSVTQEKLLHSLNLHFLICKIGVKMMYLTEF